MNKFRCKMQLQDITSVHWHPVTKFLRFSAAYDNSIPEDRNFNKSTPSAKLTMQVDNPVVLDQLKLGEYYYLDFELAEPKA